MMGPGLLIAGVFLVIFSLDLQPWHLRWRNPLLILAGSLIFVGLLLTSPIALAVAVPLGGLAAIVVDCIRNWSQYFGKKTEAVPIVAADLPRQTEKKETAPPGETRFTPDPIIDGRIGLHRGDINLPHPIPHPRQ